MLRKTWIVAALAIAALAFASPTPSVFAAEQAATVARPFNSLPEFEKLIPIGMTRDDLAKILGQPPIVVPGQGSDDVYQYPYPGADGSEIRAVIVVRDGKVFIRRLYEKSATGDMTRAN